MSESNPDQRDTIPLTLTIGEIMALLHHMAKAKCSSGLCHDAQAKLKEALRHA